MARGIAASLNGAPGPLLPKQALVREFLRRNPQVSGVEMTFPVTLRARREAATWPEHRDTVRRRCPRKSGSRYRGMRRDRGVYYDFWIGDREGAEVLGLLDTPAHMEQGGFAKALDALGWCLSRHPWREWVAEQAAEGMSVVVYVEDIRRA